MHILCVNNDPLTSHIQKLALDVTVDPCNTLNEVFDHLSTSTTPYNLVIFENEQTELTTEEALKILHENYPNLYIILTYKTNISDDEVLNFFKLGLTDIIPYDPSHSRLISSLVKLTPKSKKAVFIQPETNQKEVSASNKNLAQKILDNSPVGLAILNKKNHIIFWNSISSELTQISKENALENSFFSLFDSQEIFENYAVLTKVNPLTFQTEHYKAMFSDSINSDHEDIIVSLIDINDRIEKEKESEQLLNQMVILNDLSRTISTSITIDEFLENLTQQLIWVYASSVAAVYLYDSSKDVYFHAFSRTSGSIQADICDTLNEENSPITKILDNSSPLIFNNKESHSSFENLNQFETIAYYPVINKNEIVAILAMASEKESHFNDAVLSSLELLTDIVSISLQNVMLYEDVTEKNNELNTVINDLKDAKDAIEQQAGYLSQLLDETEEARRLIEKQNEAKERELNKAAVLQDNLLPEKMFESDICAFESIYIPCNEVAGDIYDVIKFDDGRIGIIIADVSDHGVSSAMIAAMFKMVFLIYAKQYDSPKVVFEKVNEAMNETINTGDYVTAFYGILTPDTKEFKYASAGHPAAIVCDALGENIRLLNTDGFFIGMFDFSDYEEKTTTLSSGDHVLMYTDGIYEIKNKAEEEYSKERLEHNFIETIKEMNMFPLATLLVTAEEFSEGVPYDDDLTLLHTIIK